MCLELQASEIDPVDLVALKGALPRNIHGIGFKPPGETPAEGLNPYQFRSESRSPEVSRYLKNVGEKLLSIGQPLGALRFFDMARRVRQDPEVALLRAKTLVALGRMDEAETEAAQFLKGRPNDGMGFYLMGRANLARSDFQGADRNFRRAENLLPASDTTQRLINRTFLQFNQILLDRDALYGRNLNPDEYAAEIQQLQGRVQEFKSRLSTFPHPEISGLEPYLDTLDKTFQSWLAEMGRGPVAPA